MMNRVEMNEEMMEQVNGGGWKDVLLNVANTAAGVVCLPMTVIVDTGESIYNREVSFKRTKQCGEFLYHTVTNITEEH